MSTDETLIDKPRSRLGCALLLIVLFLGLGIAYYFYRQRQLENAVTASEGRITLEKDGEDMKVVNRRSNHELWYRVMLEDVPLDATLSLECEWIDPAGNVVHRNRYKTKDIDKSPWQTHAKHRVGPTAPLGTWTVRLLLRGRELHTKTFEVRDAD